ncbi:MarR family winged helix-turn-helix transcriptional regulator [Bradyrhizobium sp.]|jgi:DNA-binding MarR family transcriptional regulator|uniref:MarR family winged helix-turn-helix transcriptional regulator n=1 Tax=Bradyrhizobium sp. TaxID=376 RepID=UPI003BAEE77B
MYRLSDAFPYLLNRVGVRMGELFSRRLGPYGVTLSMYRVMATLWEKGNQRLGELSDITSVELSTLSRLVGAMTRKGLVSRKRPDANARTVEINLTAKGRALVEQLIPLAMLYENVGLRSFRPDKIAELKRDLIKVFQNLSELDDENRPTELPMPPKSLRVRRVARNG